MKKLAVAGAAVVLVLAGLLWFRSEKPPAATEDPTPTSVQTPLHFVEAATEMGLDFVHHASYSAEKYFPETFGSGLALADFNRDGAPDVLCVDSGRVGAEEAGKARHRLYFNDGQGHFKPGDGSWQLPWQGYAMGVAVGDVDNDGWPDVFLTCYDASNRLFRNTGAGFDEMTDAAGLLEETGSWSSSAAFFDMEGDGDLDLYVVRYLDYAWRTAERCYMKKVHVYCQPVSFPPLLDQLYENDGSGHFVEVGQQRGIELEAAGRGLGIVTGDLDRDGDTDLYVANDQNRNLLWINDGRGHFQDLGQHRGVAYSELGNEEAGMGVDFSDFNGDGLDDICCTNFQRQVTSIYTQTPGLFFQERAEAVGVGSTSRQRLGFGADFFDADNDGDEELLNANGHVEPDVALYRPLVRFAQQNTLFENRGDGRMVDVSDGAGPALQTQYVGRGLVSGDLDGDGDLDFIVSNNAGPLEVARNESRLAGPALVLWLEGKGTNRSAIGARVTARIGGRELVREVRGSSSYLSVCDFRLHFGLAGQTKVEQLRIAWPGGPTQELGELGAGFYRIVEGEPAVPFTPGERVFAP